MALPSKILTYAFKTFYAGGGLGETGYRYKKAFLEKLPVYAITAANFEDCKHWLQHKEYEMFEEFLAEKYKLTKEERYFIETALNNC